LVHVGGGQDGRLDGSINLGAGVVVGELSHALEHECRGVGLHELEHSGATELVGLTNILVNVVKDPAGGGGVDADKLVQRDDHQETLEVRHGLLALEVRLIGGQNLGVANVSKGADVNLDLVAVGIPDGALELAGKVGDVLLGDGGQVDGRQTAEAVNGEAVVGGNVVNLDLADEVSESQDGSAVQEELVLDLLLGGQFLQENNCFSILHYVLVVGNFFIN